MPSRILAVDDDPRIADLTARFLTNFGYDVRCLSDSRKTLESIESFNPELCILDVNMPHISGPDLLDDIKSVNPHIEVILLTGLNDTVLAVDLMKRGAADFLLKPIDSKQMEIAVARALEHRKLVLENLAYKSHLEALVQERSKALNEALKSLREVHFATIETLATALDYRDRMTSGHSRRVADMTVGIARDLGVANGDLVQIERGALLHDIGKLRIPDSILLKPSTLTPEEWEIIRRHPDYGFDFVNKIGFLKEASDIVLSHHEKYDGTGYPRGLKGNEISFGARIFSLVDAVDAIICDRPYHRGTTFSVAREEIVRLSGSHFDPEIVEPCLTYLAGHLDNELCLQ